MKSKILLLCVVSVLFAACSSKPKKEVTGEALFKGYGCNTCHKVGNEGGVLGPDLTYIGFRKSAEWLDLWLQNPSAWKHNTSMPNFFLKKDQRKALVEYLVSLQGQHYEKNAPWKDPALANDSVARGKALFNAVGCVGCHGVEGKGGYPNNNVIGGKIPTLTLVADGFSKEELVEKMSKGVAQSVSADPSVAPPMIHMPAWGQKLKREELEDLADYLMSLRPQGTSESWE